MDESTAVKVKYLDASVIVKLFLDENGSKRFRDYFFNSTNYCTTFMTFYEAMNVLKRNLFKTNTGKYYTAVEELAILGWSGKIEVESVELNNINVFKEVRDLSISYNLDVADAIQIYAILNSKYSFFIRESASVLLTADKELELAATAKGIRVWNCINNERPDWLED